MKILMIDKYYFIKGGAERYYFELKKVLEQNGHQVIPFAMRHPKNFATPYAKYFAAHIEFNGLSLPQKLLRGPAIAKRVIYSKPVHDTLVQLIEQEKPDVAHLHMIDHQLSPSILHALKAFGIPVIQTCHQYKHVCPSYRLFIMHKNEICERCLSGGFYHAVLRRCLKKSFAASALVAVESYVHRYMKLYALVDTFHVPSRFLGEKLAQGGFPGEKIWHQYYTINLADYPYHPEAADYCVYYGRLSEEKGVLSLLKAIVLLPEVKLKILGDGPQRGLLETFVRENALKNVEFCGNIGGTALVKTVQSARFVVVPSEWYDNSPLVIYESFSMGKPVIASKIGGMPELVDHGKNGLHFAAGNVNELSNCIRQLWQNPGQCEKMGIHARSKAELEFSPEAHYARIVQAYQKLLNTAADIGEPAPEPAKSVSAAS